jgi:hypothetical protein
MSNDRNLIVVGQITNNGGTSIVEMGFAITASTAPDYCTIPDYYTTPKWNVDVSGLKPDGTFSTTLTGLTSNTNYYVRSYSKNNFGLGQSNLPTLYAKTTGVLIFPVVTCYIINSNTSLPQLNYEIGTTTNIIVSGETVKNDETLFISLNLDQISQPQPPNPIKNWTGYQATYTTASSVSIIFTPTSYNSLSQFMTQTSIYNCGNPNYTITDTKTANAYYPYLWVLKSSSTIMTDNWFAGIVPGGGGFGGITTYFYSDASTSPSSLPKNGKLIENKGTKTFIMYNNSTSYQYLAFGYPAAYGDSTYSLNGGTPTVFPSVTKNVGTGPNGGAFGIINSWSNISYRILMLSLGVSTLPTTFEITFI